MKQRSKIDLTKKEEEIMSVLWAAKHPLTVTDICDQAENMGFSLNQSTVQMLVKKLLKAELIKVGGITQTHKALARAFEPVITADDYYVSKIKSVMNDAGSNKKTSLIAALLEDKDLTKENLNELTSRIEDLIK